MDCGRPAPETSKSSLRSQGGGSRGNQGFPRESERSEAADAKLVERQLGRPPRAFRRVVVRCPFGGPAVTEQRPYDENGEPFPTTYYVTCRHLVAAIARLEAVGGVERWTEAARTDPELKKSLERASAEQRRLRAELAGDETGPDGGASLGLGIGGSSNPEQLKCLHAHAAFALANPGYLLGERILAEVVPLWPEKCCLGDTHAVPMIDAP